MILFCRPEKADFLFDVGDVLVVYLFKRFEGVAGVSSAPKGALVADAASTCPAIDAQLLSMDFTPDPKKKAYVEFSLFNCQKMCNINSFSMAIVH